MSYTDLFKHATRTGEQLNAKCGWRIGRRKAVTEGAEIEEIGPARRTTWALQVSEFPDAHPNERKK